VHRVSSTRKELATTKNFIITLHRATKEPKIKVRVEEENNNITQIEMEKLNNKEIKRKIKEKHSEK